MAARQLSEADLRRWMAEKGPQLIVLSTGICRDRHRAEEIVQEALARILEKVLRTDKAVENQSASESTRAGGIQ